MKSTTPESLADVLIVLRAGLGDALTCYILDSDTENLEALVLSSEAPSSAQQSVLSFLRQVTGMPATSDAPEANRAQVLRAIVATADESGRTIASHLREQAGGDVSAPGGADDLENAIAQLAVDTFPTFLLPPDDEPFPFPRIGAGIYVTRQVFRHSQRQTFEDELVKRKPIGRLFVEPEGNSGGGPGTMLWRNTGQGGSLQATMLPETILGGAWRHVRDENPTPAVFAAEAIAQLKLVLEVLRGRTKPIEAKFAFTGILLPDGMDSTDFADGFIEPVGDRDRELAPPSLQQQLTGNDAAGNSVVINYDGDVLLRASFPLKAKAEPWDSGGTPTSWPEEVQVPDKLEKVIERLRLSLLLAVKRDHRVQLVPTWRLYDDPFGYGTVTSWFDPKNAVGIMPTKLTADEVQSWKDWYSRLRSPHVDRIQLAVTRVIKAVAERREPADVLIDSVIAWENLFGTSEGEPTLRVTASMALLLESDKVKRKKLRKRLAEIYRLRSTVVHGSGTVTNAQAPMCQEALDLALQALQVVTKDRIDVLELPDGAARSLHLILGS